MKKEYFQAVSKESMLLFIRTLEDQGFRLIDFRENMAGLKLGDVFVISRSSHSASSDGYLSLSSVLITLRSMTGSFGNSIYNIILPDKCLFLSQEAVA